MFDNTLITTVLSATFLCCTRWLVATITQTHSLSYWLHCNFALLSKENKFWEITTLGIIFPWKMPKHIEFECNNLKTVSKCALKIQLYTAISKTHYVTATAPVITHTHTLKKKKSSIPVKIVFMPKLGLFSSLHTDLSLCRDCWLSCCASWCLISCHWRYGCHWLSSHRSLT